MQNSRFNLTLFAALIFTFAFALNINGQIAAGGQFRLDQSVVSGGGAQSAAGGQFSLAGTTAQSIAGQKGTTAPFSMHAGFWNGAPLTPTAASVALSGRITAADGSGIRKVIVTLTEANGTSHATLSSDFGYYVFPEIEVGQTVIVNVRAKRFTFAQPTLIFSIVEDYDALNFVAIQ